MSTDYYPYTIIGFKIPRDAITKKVEKFNNHCRCTPKNIDYTTTYCPDCGQLLRYEWVDKVIKFSNFKEVENRYCRYILNDKFEVVFDSDYGTFLYVGKLFEGDDYRDSGIAINDFESFYFTEIRNMKEELEIILKDLSIEYTFGVWQTILISS